jgi:hypothetical protein
MPADQNNPEGILDDSKAPAAAPTFANFEDLDDAIPERIPEGDEPTSEPAEKAADADQADKEPSLFGDDEDGETKDASDKADEDFEVALPDGSKLTGKELKELKEGQLRQADYTRKTQEIARNREALEAEAQRVTQQETQLQTITSQVLAVLQAKMPPKPDPALAMTDPLTYTQQMALYNAAAEEVASIAGHQKQQEAESAARQEQVRATVAKQEAELLKAAFPQLADPKKAKTFVSEIQTGVEHYGFTDEEFSNAVDHRLWRMAADAVMYRKIVAAKNAAPKPAQDSPKAPPAPSRPGVRASDTSNRDQAFKTSLDRLAKTGSLKDAARAFEHFDLTPEG